MGWEESGISFLDLIYDAPVGILVENLATLPASVSGVLLVGHNPGLNQLASLLGSILDIQLEPASIVIVRLDLEKWAGIPFSEGSLTAHFRPD